MEASLARRREPAARLTAAPRMPRPEPAPVSLGAPMPPLARAPRPACEALPNGEMSSLAGAAGARECLTPDLPRAVIGRESAYLPCAVSPKGALGFMRLMPYPKGNSGFGILSIRSRTPVRKRSCRGNFWCAMEEIRAGPGGMQRRSGQGGYGGRYPGNPGEVGSRRRHPDTSTGSGKPAQQMTRARNRRFRLEQERAAA